MLRTRLFALAGLVAVAVTAVAEPANAQDADGGTPLVVGVPGNMPLTGIGEDGGARGILAEAAVAVLESMGHDVRLQPMPFGRMYAAISQGGPGSIDVALSVLPTAARHEEAHYAPTMVTEYSVIAAPSAKGYAPGRSADLKGRVLGGRTGFRYPGLDDMAGLSIKRTDSHLGNARMALANRIDGLLIGSITGVWELRQGGLMEQLTLSPVAFYAIPLTVALNRDSFDATALAAFDAALVRFMNSPAWTTLVERNEASDLLKTWPLSKD